MCKTQRTWEEDIEREKILTDSDGGRSYDKAGACNYCSGNVEKCSMALNNMYRAYYEVWWRYNTMKPRAICLQMEGAYIGGRFC
jgi:hypothetical protein